MKAVFIRHGAAEPAGSKPDADRRLTRDGRAQSRATAQAVRAMGIRLELLLTSPLRRAVQTASDVAGVHDGPEVEVEDALAPPADPGAVRARLAALAREGKSAVGLVGHTPSLEECIAAVLGTPRLEMSLSKAGAACVEVPSPESADAPELSWLMSREQLAAVSKATNG